MAMKKNHSAISRRTFIKTTGSMAVTATLPGWAKSVYAQEEQKTSGSPNDKIQIGLVGCGGQGSRDAANAEYKGAKIVAICDVDAQHMAVAQEKFPDAQGYADFRELLRRDDVDAVICGTVDHWHTLVSMASMRAGKDIYCEKPLTLTLDEGKRLVNMQKETGRVFQTGTQQRSSDYFRTACNLVRNKRIGEIKEVEVWVPAGLRQGPFQSTAIPEGFNYDFWLGQTPEVPYVKERTHFSFRYWWEYSGGTMTDWGAHHNDIVLWALDMDGSGPVAIEGKPLIDMIPGGFTATSEFEVQFTYANGVVHTCRSTTDSEWNGYPKNPDGQQHGIKFIGSEGWIWAKLALVIGMAVLIVAGLTVVAITVVKRSGDDGATVAGAVAVFGEAKVMIPADARVESTAVDGGRLVVTLVRSDGSYQTMVVDLATGKRLGMIRFVPGVSGAKDQKP